MKIIRGKSFFAVTVLISIFSASLAVGASLTVNPPIGNSFTVQGTDLSNVGGIELTLAYDTSSLASPTVSEGSLITGALMAANAANPGSIKIAIITTTSISGSGPVVTINFASRSGNGGFSSISANMIDSKGANLPVQYSIATGSGNSESGLISTPGVPFSQPGSTTTTSTTTGSTGSTTTSTTTSSMPSVLGTVTMSPDTSAKGDAKPAETKQAEAAAQPQQSTPEPPAANQTEQTAAEKPAVEPQKQEKIKITSYAGILESFRAYKGEKIPAILTGLFNKEISPNIRQEPAIAISNGKTPVKIIVHLEVPGDRSPNFALNGAKLVSLSKDSSSTWVIEALPLIGIIEAGLTILSDNETIEYPLTLAPSFAKVTPVEADFAAFLKDSGATSPKRDLNGDGRHDYLDDYIYTANYLLKKSEAVKTKK